MRSTSMVLCLVLLLNLSPGHTSGATAAPATSPKTISLDVPWEQALEAVLKLTGLAQERQGNIILVAPAERFRSARQERVQAYQAEAQTEPKIIRVVPVNYASATQLKATLEKLLGACAIIAVDGRTNTLILSGTPSCLRVWEGTR
jgi:type II secretory pathway component HofQ